MGILGALESVLGVSWLSWGRLGMVLRPSWRSIGGGYGGSSGVLGRLGACMERLEHDFRTKMKHSTLDTILYSIFTRFYMDLSISRTREKGFLVLQK